LAANTRYWVVANTVANGPGVTPFDGYWSNPSQSDTNGSLFYNNSNSTWNTGFAKLGLRVNSIPEPTSLGLLLLGSVSLLRRRRQV
jgi:hypothetical protein